MGLSAVRHFSEPCTSSSATGSVLYLYCLSFERRLWLAYVPFRTLGNAAQAFVVCLCTEVLVLETAASTKMTSSRHTGAGLADNANSDTTLSKHSTELNSRRLRTLRVRSCNLLHCKTSPRSRRKSCKCSRCETVCFYVWSVLSRAKLSVISVGVVNRTTKPCERYVCALWRYVVGVTLLAV